MPKKAAFVMPTDEQIWEEVHAQLARFPDVVKKSRAFIGPDELFRQKKQWYLNTPKREAEDAARKKEEAKQKALAEKAFLAERKRQGKPVYTQEELVAKYPSDEKFKNVRLSVKELHEHADVISLLVPASDLRQEYMHFQSVSRKKLFECLSRAYGIYLDIVSSSVREKTIDGIKSLLITLGLKTVVKKNLSDIHCFISFVFNTSESKTVHVYANTFKIAMAYEIAPADYTAFIKTELGGIEEIRKAYAKVRAADAGKLKPAYLKTAEAVASVHSLNSIVGRTFQLGHGEGRAFQNDILDRYCLVLAHVDMLDQIEIISQVPSTPAIEKYLIDNIGQVAQEKGNAAWQKMRDASATHNLKKFLENHEAKEKKRAEKEALKKKKQEALAKKNAADERRFAKQRAKSQATPKSTAKKATKTKA